MSALANVSMVESIVAYEAMCSSIAVRADLHPDGRFVEVLAPSQLAIKKDET